MGASAGHSLLVPAHSCVHRLPAHLKILTLLAFVLVVVSTPGGAWTAYPLYAVLVLGVWALTRVPLRQLARRMVVEVPFVAFALLMPFVATGPRVTAGPLHLSQAGLTAAGVLLATSTLGVMAALALATTTEPRDLVVGLERLRLPAMIVSILGFMVRYLDVVLGELDRMRVARASRGFRATSVRQWPALAATVGTVFIRSYERGERVHLAMLSRGYTGTMPRWQRPATTAGQWAGCVAVVLLALLALAVGAAR